MAMTPSRTIYELEINMSGKDNEGYKLNIERNVICGGMITCIEKGVSK
jgi:hypothetical protein